MPVRRFERSNLHCKAFVQLFSEVINQRRAGLIVLLTSIQAALFFFWLFFANKGVFFFCRLSKRKQVHFAESNAIIRFMYSLLFRERRCKYIKNGYGFCHMHNRVHSKWKDIVSQIYSIFCRNDASRNVRVVKTTRLAFFSLKSLIFTAKTYT